MARNRFQSILRCFHVADNRRIPNTDSEHYRPHLKFKPFVDFMNRMFGRFYIPEQNVCVDETLIASRGRTTLLQYIPSKSAKFGVKFWVLAESSTGYIIRMICYLGKVHDPVIQGLQGTNVVIRLLNEADLFNRGYHVFVDSFFCSIDLAQRLLQHGTYVTGTLRSNRPMPMMIKTANPDPGTSKFVRQGEILIGAFKGAGRKKPVRILSTGTGLTTRDGIPSPISLYNRNMGGVDENDMLMSFYNAGRRSIKVWKNVVFNLTFRIVLNAYVLYRKKEAERNQRTMTRLKFIQSIVRALAQQEHEHDEIRPTSRRRRIVKLAGNMQRDCSVCSDRRGRGRFRSRFSCSGCKRGVHPRCWCRHVCTPEE